jgi:hypothetical protein
MINRYDRHQVRLDSGKSVHTILSDDILIPEPTPKKGLTVMITDPLPGKTYSGGTSGVTIDVTATVTGATNAAVHAWLTNGTTMFGPNSTQAGDTSGHPWKFEWLGVRSGTYTATVQARAMHDSASDSIVIQVNP